VVAEVVLVEELQAQVVLVVEVLVVLELQVQVVQEQLI
jgi:hypothetical protein